MDVLQRSVSNLWLDSTATNVKTNEIMSKH